MSPDFAYTPDTEWRNRAEFLHGRAEVVEFLIRFYLLLIAFHDLPNSPIDAAGCTHGRVPILF
ncbi:MAG: DUF1348 family protein [Roseimicrobium sp.]